MDLRHEAGTGRGRDRIELQLRLGGALTPDQSARVREIAKRCPVHRMLAGGVEIGEA